MTPIREESHHMAHDPRQTIIDFVSTPISTADSPVEIESDAGSRKGEFHTSGGLSAVVETIRFLKERTIPLHYAALVSFQDTSGQAWEFACFAVQEEQRHWYFKGGSSISRQNKNPLPHANLAGGLAEGGFYAGGYIHANGTAIVRASLVSVDGFMFEDTVDDGRVLFVTDREDVFPPVRVLLYDNSDALINSHIVFGL